MYCFDTVFNFFIYSCDCSGTGYVGEYCQVDIDECQRYQPCKNGGVCTNTPGGYDCKCRGTGYTGKNCEQSDINACKAVRQYPQYLACIWKNSVR